VGLSNDFDRIPLSFNLYYNGYDSELTSFTDGSFTEVGDVEIAEDYGWGGKLYSILETSSNNKLILTAGWQADVYQAEGQLENGNKAELTTWTIAVEDDYWITEKLSVAAGGIFVYFDQTRLDQTSNAFNPQLALAWQATPLLSVHVSAAERTRFPKLRELYRRRFGNPDLDPQTADNYELGVVLQLSDGWASDASVFYSVIDGLIERADRRAKYTNFDRVTIEGIEAGTSYWFNEAFFTRFAYTYVNAEEDLPDGGSRQLRSRPKNTALAELRYYFPHEVVVSLSGIYVAGLYDLDPDDMYSKLSNYFVANFKASWGFSDHCETYLAWSNLADTDYLQRLGDPREGRALVLGLAAEF
jgi:outer membrane receptor protein involved in Fe transport